MKDDTEDILWFSSDVIAHFEYGVRVVAYRSLRELGVLVPKIETERKPTEAEQRSLRQSYWQKSFTEAFKGEWQVISVEDGDTRGTGGHDTTAIIVICGKGKAHCTFRLIPTQWNNENFAIGEGLAVGENLGICSNTYNSPRHFFLVGAMPSAVKEKLKGYFGLSKP